MFKFSNSLTLFRISYTMGYKKRLYKALNAATRYELTPCVRLAIFSDVHRGNGSHTDNFLKNRNLYDVALKHYFDGGYAYVEIGDGDELWENRNFENICAVHHHTFELLEYFKAAKRYLAVYGNHDYCKKWDKWCRQGCTQKLQEAIIFEHHDTGFKFALTHGHQVQAINSSLWLVGMCLVRYIWKPLEHLGLKDPTDAAVNNKKVDLAEERLYGFAKEYGVCLLTGHTHRPRLPDYLDNVEGQIVGYMNSGSCIHPEGITCIELSDMKFTLVKWICAADDDDRLMVVREVMAELTIG